MADNRNAGWRGRYGWGEQTGARSSFGEEGYSSEMWSPEEPRYDDRGVLQGGYRDDGQLQGGPGRDYRGGRDDYGRGYGVEWADDRGYGRPDRHRQEAQRHADRSYDYGPYTPYGRRAYNDGRAAGAPRHGRDHGYGQRPAEGRSFMQHNDYVEAVTDGARSPGEHYGRGPKDYRRSDERIREDINDRLTDDGWLDATHVEVSVSEGEVTLSGTVGNRQAKRRAEDLAERVSGVRDVQNNIRVNRDAEQSTNDQMAAASAIAGPTV